jgi:hypothetical protein
LWVQPVAALQASVVQAFPSLQFGGVPRWQTPATHVSRPLQALPSSHCAALVHAAQPAMAVCVQPVAGLQASVVHAFPSLQFGGVPGWQTPALHVSCPLHALPSSHRICAHEQPLVLTAAPGAVPWHESRPSGTPSPSRVGAGGIRLARVDHAVEIAILRRIREPVAVRVDHRRDLRVRQHDLVRVRAVDAVRAVRGDDDAMCRADVEPGHDGRKRAVRRRDGQARVQRERERPAGRSRVHAIARHRRVRGRAPVRADGVRCRRGAAREDDPARQHPPHHPRSHPHGRARSVTRSGPLARRRTHGVERARVADLCTTASILVRAPRAPSSEQHGGRRDTCGRSRDESEKFVVNRK